MDWEIFQFGTLYEGREPVSPPKDPRQDWDAKRYKGGKISIGDTVRGKAITWIKPRNMDLYVADRVLLVEISWNELEQYNLMIGKNILIDGQSYLCRAPMLGYGDFSISEWERCLAATTKDNKLWHWEDMCFFGKEEIDGDPRSRPAIGHETAISWRHLDSDFWDDGVGYRPVLLANAIPEDSVGVELEGQLFAMKPTEYVGLAGSQTGTQSLALYPVSEKHLNGNRLINRNLFPKVWEGEVIRMYTLLMDDSPVCMKPGYIASYKVGAKLRLTDEFFGSEYLIPWKIRDGVAYANKALLKNYF